MATTMDESTRTMLLLAGLAYRGFHAGVLRGATSGIVRGDLQHGLAELLEGEWQLVWGPATSRMVGDAFDACGMYLARHRDSPDRHVIAVRGTNPISFTDWLYGDFNVGAAVVWPFGDGTAHVSTSTAHGLVSLLALAWEPDDVDVFVAHLAERLRIPELLLDGVRALARERTFADDVRGTIATALTDMVAGAARQARLTGLVGRLLATQLAVVTDQLRWQPPARGSLLAALAAAADDGPLDVVVTGHSKGGSLAPALALWLAETRRLEDGSGWDATRRSRVRYCAFAGPTPGDGAFAARALALAGEESVRVVNEHDIVARAWDAELLNGVAGLYGRRSAELGRLVADVVQGLARAGLDYRHVGEPTVSFAGALDEGRSPGEEIVYQHMDAYLEHAGVPHDALTLFVG